MVNDSDDCNGEDDSHDDNISDLTKSMTKALHWCLASIASIHDANMVQKQTTGREEICERNQCYDTASHTPSFRHTAIKDLNSRRVEGLQEILDRINDSNNDINTSSNNNTSSNTSMPSRRGNDVIETVDLLPNSKYNNNKSSSKRMTSLQLKRAFIHRNIPCLIRGLDATSFERVTTLWTNMPKKEQPLSPGVSNHYQVNHNIHHGSTNNTIQDEERKEDFNSSRRRNSINVDWFEQNVSELVVPVKKSSSSLLLKKAYSNDGKNDDGVIYPGTSLESAATREVLDAGGRAQECVPVNNIDITVQNWISEEYRTDPNTYLKDWHLIMELEKRQPPPLYIASNKQRIGSKQPHDRIEKCWNDKMKQTMPPPPLPLYSVPSIFQGDMLNSFLTKFSDSDYRFVYWGPKHSCTTLHSDVLNSFSWSYNVIGTKKWTFYPPTIITTTANESSNKKINYYSCTNNNDYASASFVVTQNAGECIFVPSQWRHEVVNVEETLSINHNWFSAVNIDYVWDCIQVELKAVDTELELWGLLGNSDDTSDDFVMKETMLHSCIGMNVTTFFFALLVEMVQLFLNLNILLEKSPAKTDPHANETADSNTNNASKHFEGQDGDNKEEEDPLWELYFNLQLLQQMMKILLIDKKNNVNGNSAPKNTENYGGDCCCYTTNKNSLATDPDLVSRLSAILADCDLAKDAIHASNYIIKMINDALVLSRLKIK